MSTPLADWVKLFDAHSVAPDGAEAEHFKTVFGDSATPILVRPDGYVGFLSDARATDKLAAYLGKWFKTDDVPRAGGPRRGWNS